MYKTVKVYAHCCVCGKTLKRSIKLPISWVPLDPCMHYVRALCHEHRNINKFFEANCNYCIYKYGDSSCGLTRLGMHIKANNGIAGKEYKETLNDVRKGICPYHLSYEWADKRPEGPALGGKEMKNYLLEVDDD